MPSQPPKKPPHEVLGVPKDADFMLISAAYNRLANRFHPRNRPANDQLAEQRFKLIREAYEALLASEIGFHASPDPLLDGWDFDFPQSQQPSSLPARKRSAKEKFAQRTQDFRLKLRVEGLLKDWNDYIRTLNQGPQIVKKLKATHGDRFIRLKAIFPGNDDARTLWAAERYIKGGGHCGIFRQAELRGIVYNLQHAMRGGYFDDRHRQYLELAEEDLKDRRNCLSQAIDILDHKRRYIDFHVP